MRQYAWCVAIMLIACSADRAEPADNGLATPVPEFEPPVVTNAESPVVYPLALYEERVEGTVVLHLYVDGTGTVVADSTRIAEGSGYPELDGAALAAVDSMRFAPARRNGAPVATAFLQPVHFRHLNRPSGSQP